MSYLDKNRAVWNRLADNKSTFARVATDQECQNPLMTLDTRGWLPPSVRGLNVLCLASGGGWQSILYAVAGANVTVVDISESMLRLDEQEAKRRNVHVKTVHASMDDLSSLSDQKFDIVHHPVSTCYIANLADVYREVARVIKPAGLYISQHKTPTSLQITRRNADNHFVVGIEYYHPGPLPRTRDESYRETGAVEYLHRWEELIGGLCQVGFSIEDMSEPLRADPKAPVDSYRYRGRYIAPYVRLKARRNSESHSGNESSPAIWTP